MPRFKSGDIVYSNVRDKYWDVPSTVMEVRTSIYQGCYVCHLRTADGGTRWEWETYLMGKEEHDKQWKIKK